MHDLIEAQNILQALLEFASREKIKKILEAKIEIGLIEDHHEILTPENLLANLNLLSKNTLASGCKFQIKLNKKIKNHWLIKEIIGY